MDRSILELLRESAANLLVAFDGHAMATAMIGRGKVILLGEHGVVYGHPALAAGLGVGVEATAAEASDGVDGLDVAPWNVSIRNGQTDSEGAESLAEAYVAVRASYPPSPVRVHAQVELPAGAGLGCSAALGVAVIAALDEHFQVSRTPSQRAEFALAWERVFHGNPSGVDNTMAACGGVALFRKGVPLEPVRPRRPLHLAIGHSGEASSTKEIVAMVARQRDKDPARVDKVFDGIAALVRNARLAVEAGDLKALGQLLDMNQALLSSLMLSTESLEALCAAARDAGALGAKLTGAGAGGCMFALAESAEHAETIRQALARISSLTFVAEAGA